MFFNVVQRRRYFFLFSGIVILVGIIAMIASVATYPERSIVRLSIDFLGGNLMEIAFVKMDTTKDAQPITEATLAAAFTKFNVADVRVQRLGTADKNQWQIRSSYISNDTTEAIKTELNTVAAPLNLKLDVSALRVSQVSPTVGGEVTRAAFLAVLVATIAVLSWIIFAFRNVENSFRYGMSAVVAMIHDVLVMVGIMSLLGLLFGWEVDALFLTGLLTVVGYSVQDTIVVLDRIRENAARHRGEPFEMVVNRSILEIITRSLSMQALVGFVMLSLVLLGGDSVRQFVAILLIGLLSGTYSSTFTAIPILVAWERGELPLVNREAKAKPRTA
jgi:preprotein translocase SecF subunit